MIQTKSNTDPQQLLLALQHPRMVPFVHLPGPGGHPPLFLQLVLLAFEVLEFSGADAGGCRGR